jgi:Ca2+-dependent lipid-binding protein
LDIKDKKGVKTTGKIIFRVEPANESREEMYVQFKGIKLKNREWFSKSDPFLCIYRIAEDNTWLKVHATEYIGSNLNPVWKPFSITMQMLCNSDPNRPIKFECWDYERSGRHQFIGEFQTSW